MARLELDDFLDDDGIDTPPIPSTVHPEGKVYRITSPDAKTGLLLSRMAGAGLDVAKAKATGTEMPRPPKSGNPFLLDDDDERELYQKILGPAFDDMLADGVSWVRIQRLGQYMFIFYGISADAAEAVRIAGGLQPGEGRAPNRANRRKSSSSASRGSRASSTRRKPTA